MREYVPPETVPALGFVTFMKILKFYCNLQTPKKRKRKIKYNNVERLGSSREDGSFYHGIC